jgi:DNA replication protein DnaC
MLEETKKTLWELRLLGMQAALELRLAEAASHGWSGAELVSALATDERIYRDNIRTRQRLKSAKFRVDASFEKLDTTAKRNLSRLQAQTLMELSFLKEPRNVIIVGPTGVGKTFLATAIGQQACRQGYTSIFIGMNELIERVSLCRADGSFLKYREKLIKTDLLILDDLGIKRLPPEIVQDLYDILEERYQSKSTIITSQLPIENWREVIEDVVALEAIVDRLIHGAVMLVLQGESYRRKRAQTPALVDVPKG